MTIFQVLINNKAHSPVHVGVSEHVAQAVVRALQDAFTGLNITATVTVSVKSDKDASYAMLQYPPIQPGIL